MMTTTSTKRRPLRRRRNTRMGEHIHWVFAFSVSILFHGMSATGGPDQPFSASPLGNWDKRTTDAIGERGLEREGEKPTGETTTLTEGNNVFVKSQRITKSHLCESTVIELTSALLRAMHIWDNPPCYNFTYQQIPFEPVVNVQVNNGKTTPNHERSMFDWLRRIASRCIDPCDFDDVPLFNCDIVYDVDEGYPTRIYSLPLAGDGEGEMIEIGNFTSLDCASMAEDVASSLPTMAPSVPRIPTMVPSPVQTQRPSDSPSQVQSIAQAETTSHDIPTDAPSVMRESQSTTQSPSAYPFAFLETEEILFIDEPLMNNDPSEPDATRPRLQQVQGYLAAQGISARRVLETRDSPQYLAARWLADGDAMNLNIPDNRMDAQSFHQRYILAVVYFALDGKRWTDQIGFLTSEPECSWNRIQWDKMDQMQGVICNNDFQVSGLYIAGNGLQGKIPQELGHLSFLEVLNFSSNRIMGQLPTTIQRLYALKSIVLEGNLLTGSIRALETLTDLETVDLSDNHLSGTVDNIFRGDTISLLDLSKNNFAGSISEHFYNISIVDLHSNFFSGQIPEVSSSNNQIEFLSLYRNRFGGAMPGSIGYLQKLRHLDISYNKLSGPIWLSSLRNLEQLFLAHNAFSSGPIPLIHSRRLKELSLRGTNRTGTIPKQFESLKNLILLDLEDNDLNGTFPTSLLATSDLRFLFLGRNSLTGAMNNTCRGGQLHSADCREVECDCCEICCSDEDDECLSDSFITSFPGGFIRQQYAFSPLFSFDVEFESEKPPASISFNGTVEVFTSNCKDWELMKRRFDAAKLKLARSLDASLCYDMAYTFRDASGSSTFKMQVTDETIVTSDNTEKESNVSKIEDLMSIISFRCIEPCPENGPYKCNVVFEAEGYPKSITIVEDSSRPESEETFFLDSFASYECFSNDSLSRSPLPGSETLAPSGLRCDIELSPFIFHVATYGNLDRDALMDVVAEYLTIEFSESFGNLSGVELTQSMIYTKDERQRLQAKLISIYFTGMASFDASPPPKLELVSKQAEALADREAIQESIANNEKVGTGAVVSHIEILLDDNSSEGTPTEDSPTGSSTKESRPTVSCSIRRNIWALLICVTPVVMGQLW